MADAEKPEQSLEAGRESAAERPEGDPTLENVAAEETKAERAIEREERQEEGTIGAGIKAAGELGGPEGEERAEDIAGAQMEETKTAAEAAEGRVESAADGGSSVEGAKEESPNKTETDQGQSKGSETEEKAEEPQLTPEEWRARETEFRALPDRIGNLGRELDGRKRVLAGEPGTWFTTRIGECVVNGQRLENVQRDRNGVWRDGNEKQLSGDTAAELEAATRRKAKDDIARLEQEKNQASERRDSISKQKGEEWKRTKQRMEQDEAKRKAEEPEASQAGDNPARPRDEGNPEAPGLPRTPSYRDGSRGEIPRPPAPPEYLGGSLERRWGGVLEGPWNRGSKDMMREIFAQALANGENEGSVVENIEALRNEVLARDRERRDSADKLLVMILLGVMTRFGADSEKGKGLLSALNRIGSALRQISSLLEERLNPSERKRAGARS